MEGADQCGWLPHHLYLESITWFMLVSFYRTLTGGNRRLVGSHSGQSISKIRVMFETSFSF